MVFYDAGTTDINGNPINFHYQIATFKDQGETRLFQEVDSNGEVVRFTDMNGNTVANLPHPEYGITETNPARPSWGT